MDNSIWYVIYTALVFASMEPVSKLLNSQMHAFTLTFLRFFIGSLFLLPIAIREIRKKKLTFKGKDLFWLTVQGVLLVCVSMGTLQIAVFRAESAAFIAVIYCTSSVFTVIFAALILKERMTKRRILAVALCLAGICVGGGVNQHESLAAIILAFVAAISMSLFTVLGKILINRFPTKVQIGISFPIGTIILGIVELCAGIPFIPAQGNAGLYELFLILYLGVAVTGLGYLSYFQALELSGAFMASLVFFIKPILAPFMSLLILGKTNSSPLLFVSIILIVSGSLLVMKKEGGKK